MFLPLAACQLPSRPTAQPTPPPTPLASNSLAFETVARNESGVNIRADQMNDQPQLFLLTAPNEIARIQNQVNPETLRQLRNVNFDEYVVIALLRGRKPSNNYQTVIERIEQMDHQLIIHAQFWEPSPQWASTGAETSPYHLVTVARQRISDLSQVELTLHSIPLTPTPPAN